jgi:beta-phosphoglucomutase-like phosphatase (HAD superfamily)
MLNNVKAVLFDLDGTLVDSMWVWKEIDIEFLSGYDIDQKICKTVLKV